MPSARYTYGYVFKITVQKYLSTCERLLAANVIREKKNIAYREFVVEVIFDSYVPYFTFSSLSQTYNT